MQFCFDCLTQETVLKARRGSHLRFANRWSFSLLLQKSRLWFDLLSISYFEER